VIFYKFRGKPLNIPKIRRAKVRRLWEMNNSLRKKGENNHPSNMIACEIGMLLPAFLPDNWQ
jgi:hypothetical protein